MSDSTARSAQPRKLIYPYQFSADASKTKAYRYAKPCHPVTPLTIASSLAALPTAAQGQVGGFFLDGGMYMEYFQTTAQTLGPVYTAGKGLELTGDQVNNETVEYVPGGATADNPFARVVGTSPNWFFNATFEITDASGLDQFGIGYRSNEAFGVPTSFLTTGDGIYTDFFLLGFAGTAADPNPVRCSYDLNNSGSSTVAALSFTWADTKIHKLGIRVIGGRVYCFINDVLCGDVVSKDALGASITAQTTVSGPNFSFDSGDTLLPFIFARQDADIGPVYLKDIELGLLRDIGKDKNAEGRGE
jgi:hypothetical protein